MSDFHTSRLTTSENWDSDSKDAQYPLLNPAWVYQVRLLSPRIVHFTATELYWECKQGRSCECGTVDQQFDIKSNPKISWTKLDKWQQIISHYSNLSLTLEKDKLPAIAGAARELAKDQLGSYLAGCWENSPLKGIGWAHNIISRRPLEWPAPTWSWASVETNVLPSTAPCTEIDILEA